MVIRPTFVVPYVTVLHNGIVDIATQPQFISRDGVRNLDPHLLAQSSSLEEWQRRSVWLRQSLLTRTVLRQESFMQEPTWYHIHVNALRVHRSS